MVKCKAALALESIAITTPGKYSCLKEGAINHLVPLIDESLSETRVNALKAKLTRIIWGNFLFFFYYFFFLKAITCLAESPEGRRELQQYVDKVKNKLSFLN